MEISCHGSIYVARKILDLVISSGSRPAGPGGFTKRAFLNGRLDVSQAEAVADLISSDSKASHELALSQLRGTLSGKISHLRQRIVELCATLELELDFSEEGLEFISREDLRGNLVSIKSEIIELIDCFELGKVIKEGLRIVLEGCGTVGHVWRVSRPSSGRCPSDPRRESSLRKSVRAIRPRCIQFRGGASVRRNVPTPLAVSSQPLSTTSQQIPPPVGRQLELFDRVRAAFESGQMELACQGYAGLFSVLALKDAYGFAVTRPESLVVSEECLRYLRALCDTVPAPQRATRLVETMRHLMRSLWEAPKL